MSQTSDHRSLGALSDLIPCIYLSLPLYSIWFRSYLNGLVVFPYFLQFKSEFGNKEWVIWATVRSRSCFSWLYRVSPSLAAKNVISLISVLTIWWCPCRVFSCLLEEGVCYDHCVVLAKLCLPLPCFILYSKAKFAHYSRYFVTSYFCIPVPYNEKDIFFFDPAFFPRTVYRSSRQSDPRSSANP